MKQKAVDISLKWLGDKPDADTVENTIAVMKRFRVQRLRIRRQDLFAVQPNSSTKGDAFFVALQQIYKNLSATRGIDIELPEEFKEDVTFEIREANG